MSAVTVPLVHAVDPRRGPRVDVPALAERLDEFRVLREMRHDPELDLRIIGVHENVPAPRDEGAPDRAPELRPHGNILQVRLARRQPPRRRDRLVEGGVDAPGPRIHEARERVDVRALHLRELPVLEHAPGDRVAAGELGEHVLVGRESRLRLPRLREPELLEEDPLELLRRVDVELLAGEPVNLRRETVEILRDRARKARRASPRRSRLLPAPSVSARDRAASRRP